MAHEQHEQPEAPKAAGKLPIQVATTADVSHLIRELDELEDSLMQAKLRKAGEPTELPKSSRLLEQIVSLNELNLLHKTDRERLRRFLETIKLRAPVLHMSFSADPSRTFLSKLVTWLRKEIHPQVLVSVGLQPTIGVGCIVRSTNRYFDFSLRQDFAKKRSMLLEALVPGAKKAVPHE